MAGVLLASGVPRTLLGQGLISEAEHSGIPGAWDEMLLMVDEIGPALQRVEQSLPPGFPESVSEPIFMGTRMHLERFMNWRAS